MRKIFSIALGIASIGAVASVQPAAAGGIAGCVKTHYTTTVYDKYRQPHQETVGGWDCSARNAANAASLAEIAKRNKDAITGHNTPGTKYKTQ